MRTSTYPRRRPSPERRPHLQRAVWAVFCASVLMAAGAAVLTAPPASASTAKPYFALSVTPTQNLTTGEQMTIRVTRTSTGTAAGREIKWVAFAWCTPTFTPPTAQQISDTRPIIPPTSQFPTRWPIGGAHCTTVAHPLNGEILPLTLIAPQTNSSGDYPTAEGHIPAQTSEGTKLFTASTHTATGFNLVCDATHPCTFTVAVFSTRGSTTTGAPPVFLSVPVTFAATAPLAGCGGNATGMINSISANVLGDAVTNWTVGACKAGIGGGALLASNISSAQGDASALAGFASGSDDLAYSAVGYGATGAFMPSVDRPYVAVPVAIDAVVLGHVQSYTQGSPAGQSVLGDFPQQLRITDAQAAQLLGGGPKVTALYWSSPLGQALLAEDPELKTEGFYYLATLSITQGAAEDQNFGVVATSLVDATTFFATTFFNTLTPRAMVSHKTAASLGATADFGTATPPFNVDSVTTRDLVSRALTPGHGQGFALLDLATADAMWGGLADFAIQAPSSIGTGSPVYVSPTQASMDAATTEMIPQADGTLLPNPDATPVDGVQPYPLTFVEYAIAPSQPLLAPTCAPLTSSQQDLKTWLDYITGPGQSELPSGMVPLTPGLEAQAQAAIAEVGTAKPTGSCANGNGAPGSQAGPTGVPGTGNGGATATGAGTAAGPGLTVGSGAVAGSFGSSGFGTAGSTPAGSEAAGPKGTSKGKGHPGSHAVTADLAGFNRAEQPAWLLPALGVLVLVLLLPGLAFLMSGRPLRAEGDETAISSSSRDPAAIGGSDAGGTGGEGG